MNVDGEERLAIALDWLPSGGERLSALRPSGASWGNAARVELECRALEHLVDISSTALVGVVELDHVGAVDVGHADVTTGGTTILVVDGHNLSVIIDNAAERLNPGSERVKGHVSCHGAVVGSTRVVLDLLQEDEVRGLHLLDNLGSDAFHVDGAGVEIASVVVGDADATAVARRFERDGWVVGSSILLGRDSRKGQNTVETKGVVNQASNVAEEVTHLGVIRVSGPIGRGSNDDGLGVGICTSRSETRTRRSSRSRGKLTTIEHSQTTMAIDASSLPITAHPDIAKLVGTTNLVNILDGDKLTNKALPEVHSILGGVKLWVDSRETAHVVGNAEDVAVIQRGELLCGRR